MTMLEFSKMRDKQGQQRRRRKDGAVWPIAERSAVERDRPFTPEAVETTQKRSSVDREPSCVVGDFVDSAERGSLARLAGEIPASLHLLAAAARLGGAGRLVENLAVVSERVEPAPAIEVERIVSGREFCSSEKRGCGVGKTKRGKGTKWMVVVDGRGLPLGNALHPASPGEVTLAETTLATIRVGRRHRPGRLWQKPLRVIADKAYDSDPLRKRLRQRGIELICPHKRNRVRPPTQDGRALRRYRDRKSVV